MKRQWAVGSGQWAEGKGSQSARSSLPTAHCPLPTSSRGFTLIELVITLFILTILTLGVIPLVKVSVRRQREQQLREALHQIRNAIDQFHREALAAGQTQQVPGQPPQPVQPTAPPLVDPRIRVAITDNTIFGVDNPDRYPPDLDTLVSGVSVTPLQVNTPVGGPQGPAATSNALTSTKKKVYLREIPVDPMTGERDWDLRSTYDSKDATSWGGENVFDVRSKSTATALNGEKYSDW